MDTKQTITPHEWQQIFALPADGQPYNVPGVAFRAVHKPQTRIHVEYVVAETQFGTLRRLFVRGKWQATEHISGTAS